MNIESAQTKAAHLCSQSEKSPQEIYEKLLSWEVSEEDAEKIVLWLKSENFLNEERYAHAFVHDKFVYEHWGRIKIAYALRNKGIGEVLTRNTMDEVISSEEYIGTLIDLLKTKLKGMPKPLSQNDRSKVYRFAAQRGFESNYISTALRKMNVQEHDDI